ncbi:MAG: hypothetical protein HQL78_10710 [Magnetococcales bacterium]|nr:hypothetical protein [Magnetococcales bacterium]MBF0420620.1 hypothetical protein [Magnetococcales bacterium]
MSGTHVMNGGINVATLYRIAIQGQELHLPSWQDRVEECDQGSSMGEISWIWSL